MDILAQAFDLGLVTRGEVERGLVAGRPAGMPGELSITVRGRVVATVREFGAGSRPRCARAALCALAEEDLGPAVLPTADGRLWTAPVTGRSLVEIAAGEQDASLTELTAACVSLGATLAGVHRLPTRSAAASTPTSVADRPRYARESELGTEIQHAMDTDRGIQAAAEFVSRRWSARYWTLGRIDGETVRVDAFGTARFIEFESAGLGNPDWDVAACLATIARVAGVAGSSSIAWLSEHFWNSYRRSGGPGQVHPHVQAMYAIDAAWRSAEAAVAEGGAVGAGTVGAGTVGAGTVGAGTVGAGTVGAGTAGPPSPWPLTCTGGWPGRTGWWAAPRCRGWLPEPARLGEPARIPEPWLLKSS